MSVHVSGSDCFIYSDSLLSCQLTLDILLFDKLPIAPFICHRLMHHVLITLLLSLPCGASDVRGAISGIKEVLL